MPYSCCKDCHFIFQSNYVGDDFLNHYYINSPMLRRSFFTEFDIEQSKSCHRFLLKNINLDQKRILEIGAGGGVRFKSILMNLAVPHYFIQNLARKLRCIFRHIKGLMI